MVDLIYTHSDIVVGQDINENNERVVTKFICDKLFNIKLDHPTCGFIAFNRDTLLYKIPFYRAISKKDIIHLEFIFMGIKNKLIVDTIKFDTKNSEVKHNYNVKRSMLWLLDAFKMKFFDVFSNNYGVDTFITE
jgi:hypothetical protein